MASTTVENYLKQLYLQQQRATGKLVPMGGLAEAMGVTPGTATSMIKALADAELVHYEPRTGVRLTKGGEQLALHVLRRHRLVELFLVKVLDLDWSQVHEEAETLEHAISDRVLDRIDEFLDHPEVDPHGDPIPSSQGTVSQRKLTNLSDCAAGQGLSVSRILDQDPDFLQFADKIGLVPGALVQVTSRNAAAEAISVRIGGYDSITLGLTAASKILVEA